ncbi:MAG: hypothetical protein FIA92_11670 [Chloroflexi bacterium]|nr:hypothetical protein [Chloroflexota bacterium]
MRAGRVFVLIVIALLPVGAIQAAPPPAATQIRLVGPANGFVPVGEVVTRHGAVIDTFRNGAITLRVIGSPGATVRIERVAEATDGKAGLAIELAAKRPKNPDDAGAYARSGRSVVADLVALGMPEEDARREFGDMETLDPETAAQARLVASTAMDDATLAAELAVSTSSTIPYDTQCASISYEGGLIEGYGCSTIFRVAASGTDWWFNNKYKFSARSKDPTAFWCLVGTCPWRLAQVGWSLGWSKNNVLYDWEPVSTNKARECTSMTFSASFRGVGISISGNVCPEVIQPWDMGSRRSGAEWQGLEKGTAWEAAFGIQAIHSPPSAGGGYSSRFGLVYLRWNT